MFKKVLIALVVLIAGFAGFVASRPSEFHLERSASMQAPADVAFAHVNDFRKWAAWSPWEKLDPAVKKTFAGPEQGIGASYAWTGNDKVGEGSMTISAAQPSEKITIKLEFLKPWKASNITTFTFKKAGEGTSVIWAMDGQNNFMAKAASVFMDMDQMIGNDFEKGLAALKVVVEADAKARAEEAKKAEEARKAEEAKKAADEKAAAEAAAAKPAKK